MPEPFIADANAPGEPAPPPLKFFTRIENLYLFRVPLVSAALLVLLPVIGLWVAQQLFENLFVLQNGSILLATLAAYVLAWTIRVTLRVIALNREERFGVPGLTAQAKASKTGTVLAMCLPLPMLAGVLLSAKKVDPPPNLASWLGAAFAILIGIASAYLLAFFAVMLATWTAPEGQATPYGFLLIFFDWQTALLRAAAKHNPLSLSSRREVQRKAAFPNGYHDANGRVYPGHWLATASFLIFLALYIFFGFAKLRDMPALAYVLLLMILGTWLLAGAAFFLDRYRIPLLVPGLLIAMLSGVLARLQDLGDWMPSSDHFYDVQHLQKPVDPALPPAQIFEMYRKKTGGKIIVVATAGGGIQAAAWTARVLTGLQESVKPGPSAKPFADSIAAISSVSGGAVGTMYFATRYPENGSSFPEDTGQLDAIVQDAETPSLNDVAWALTFPDVVRVIFPFLEISRFKLHDRGHSLEQDWARLAGLDGRFLSEWLERTRRGTLPAVIFNSTLAETGEPMLMSTTSLADRADAPDIEPPAAGLMGASAPAIRERPHRKLFFKEHQDYDIPIVTAVRLAASFPYVAPAARPLQPNVQYHQVDGGYYDNYAVASLTAWLDQGLDPWRKLKLAQTKQHPPLAVLVIQIRHFPPEVVGLPKYKSWFYQTYAPLSGALAARSTAQLLRDNEEVSAFMQKWREEGVNVCSADFTFTREGAPLSWEMNRLQKQAITDDWNGIVQSGGASLQNVRAFLSDQPVEALKCRPSIP